MAEFYQKGPELSNTFLSDTNLQKFFKTWPKEMQEKVSKHLTHVGELAVTDWLRWSQEAEIQVPVLVPYSPWGERIDEIRMSSAWKNLEKAAAVEGIVATAYERTWGEWSRVYQMCLLYLFHSSSAFVSCPLAMTDGAARALELFGEEDLKKTAFKNLTSRDPEKFWTSGQWMTEREGGSDVSGTATEAKKNSDPQTLALGFGHELWGTKWFTSATTSQMTMLLARPEGAEAGSRGLSLFYVELRDQQNRLKKIQVNRLKDKLGTKALPTAELGLVGTPARMVGGPGQGVKKIASVLNITRIYNSICALSHMRRALDLAQSYSGKRQAFGKLLNEHVLHRQTLNEMEELFQACFKMTFFVAHLLGKDETNQASEHEKSLLRILTPVVKLFTGKAVVQICSEVCECFGGAGYIEDTGIPRLLRDAQVFSIWEGTTNVLSLDFMRALEKENGGAVLAEWIKAGKTNPEMGSAFLQKLGSLAKKSAEEQVSQSRAMAFDLARLTGSISL